ncbi:hypothetical protein ACEWY4_005106 [Coilia grayii]|uniref:Uncharacterized protein n=1 Tax=Coilia grayii TaxID=363190 RepID=A0ABD1KI04_9TELE
MFDGALKFILQSEVHFELIVFLLFVGLEHLMDVVFASSCTLTQAITMLDNMGKLMIQNGNHKKLGMILLLVGLEHLMDIVFVCPCNPPSNIVAAVLFFVIPCIVIFLLMLVAQCSPGQTETRNTDATSRPSDKEDERTPLLEQDNPTVNYSGAPAGRRRQTEDGRMKMVKRCGVACVAPVLWLTLMFFEGQFYVCAMTDWPGRFVKLNDTYEHMWCRPDTFPSKDKMKRSNDLYVQSQWIALGLLCFIMVLVVIYTLWAYCHKRKSGDTVWELDA